MTDNEIVKALECCKSENGNDCEGCPCQNVAYKQGSGGCTNALMGYALDLITRQKAEIERLQNHIKNTFENLTKQCVEHEIKTVKSEAYREFALELKCGVPQETGVIRCADVDFTLKELTRNLHGKQ